MPGCRICQSASLFEAQTLRCGHQFCKECLLCLLPDASNYSVSVLPRHIAVVVCPRCHERCEYSRVILEEERADDRGRVVRGTCMAPSSFADEAERRRLRKRAQFIQVYKRECVLSRKSRSRFLLDDDQFPVKPSRQDDNSLLANRTFGRTRNKGYEPIMHGGVPWRGRVQRGLRADDVRVIDHVNGRFVACVIVSGPGSTTDAHAGGKTPPRAADARSPRRGSTSPYAAPTQRHGYHPSPAQGTESCPLRISAVRCVEATGTSTMSCFSNLDIRQAMAAVTFVLLLIAIIVTTSIISASR